MNQILDNIYSYNRKLFRNIPLSSILFGLITILIFTKPQLIGEININNYISSGVQKILNHLANTIYNPIFLLIIFITICFIASILNEIGHKLPTFKKKKLTFNNMEKLQRSKVIIHILYSLRYLVFLNIYLLLCLKYTLLLKL